MDRGRARGLSALPPPPFTNSALLRVCDKHASVKINARNLLNLTQKTVLAINSENFTPNTKGDLITTISYFFENVQGRVVRKPVNVNLGLDVN